MFGFSGISTRVTRSLVIPIVMAVAFWTACGGGSGPKITTFAGKNLAGYTGDGGVPTDALLFNPGGVAVDSTGNVYIADTSNFRIRKVSGGKISTIAGSIQTNYSGDGGPATSAGLNSPVAVAVDSGGNVYIADQLNNAVRKVDTGGIITTIAGNGTPGYNGDNILGTAAQLNLPSSVAVDSSGNVYIADHGNHRVREVMASSGLIVTFAGTGVAGFSGDGAAASAAKLNSPRGVAVDTSGNVFIVDQGNNVIRKVSSGNISTIAGDGTAGFLGDGGAATKAEMANPSAIAVDAAGNLYIADPLNSRIRKVSTDGNMTTVAGNGTAGFNGDDGAATKAEINGPSGVAIDANGHLFIADSRNQVIRQVSF